MVLCKCAAFTKTYLNNKAYVELRLINRFVPMVIGIGLFIRTYLFYGAHDVLRSLHHSKMNEKKTETNLKIATSYVLTRRKTKYWLYIIPNVSLLSTFLFYQVAQAIVQLQNQPLA